MGNGQASPPVQGNDGNLYGTIQLWRDRRRGCLKTILTPAGRFNAVHTFLCYHTDFVIAVVVPSRWCRMPPGNLFGVNRVWRHLLRRRHAYSKLPRRMPLFQSVQFQLRRIQSVRGIDAANDGNFYGPHDRTATIPFFSSLLLRARSTRSTRSPRDQQSSYLGLFFRRPTATSTEESSSTTDQWNGAVYSFSNNDLSPLVETNPTMGKVGKSVIILGNGLTGTTSVTFNGVAAKYTVESDSYIKATVPEGATTGTVSVVTPSGTLNSSPQFVVTK